MSKYNFTGTWMMMLRRQRVYHNISILPIMCARANVALERPDHLCIVCNYQRRCVSVVSHMHVWHVSHHLKKKNNLHSRPNRARLRCIHVGKKIGLGRIFLLRIFHRGSEWGDCQFEMMPKNGSFVHKLLSKQGLLKMREN